MAKISCQKNSFEKIEKFEWIEKSNELASYDECLIKDDSSLGCFSIAQKCP